MKHDALIKQLQALAKTADRKSFAGAFLASLGVKPAPWRAPICALAAAERVPTHTYRPFSASSSGCRECGLEPVTDFDEEFPMSERGEILPGDLVRALLVLEWARAQTSVPTPSTADAKRLTAILALIGKLPAAAREGQLNKAIRAAKLSPGNVYDARAIVTTLGALGILETPEHPGFTTAWSSFGARQDRPSSRGEVDPPIAFWTAAHGVNAKHVAHWFGALSVTTPASTRPRALPVAKASASASRRDKRAARSTELALGDVLAIKLGTTWRAGIVIGHHQDRGGRFPIITPSTWKGRAVPTLAQAKSAARMPLSWMMDIWVRNDKKGQWQTIGSLPTPHQPGLVGYAVGRLERDRSGLARLFR